MDSVQSSGAGLRMDSVRSSVVAFRMDFAHSSAAGFHRNSADIPAGVVPYMDSYIPEADHMASARSVRIHSVRIRLARHRSLLLPHIGFYC